MNKIDYESPRDRSPRFIWLFKLGIIVGAILIVAALFYLNHKRNVESESLRKAYEEQNREAEAYIAERTKEIERMRKDAEK